VTGVGAIARDTGHPIAGYLLAALTKENISFVINVVSFRVSGSRIGAARTKVTETHLNV